MESKSTLVSDVPFQSSTEVFIYIAGAIGLLVLPKIDAVLAQVSTAMLVLLAVGHVLKNRYWAKTKTEPTAEAASRRPRATLPQEKYEYVPPNRAWSRRTRYRNLDGASGAPKKCQPRVLATFCSSFNQGCDAYSDSQTSGQAPAAAHAPIETPVRKYQELLNAGAKPHLAVPQRKSHTRVIPEEDAKRLLERLFELERNYRPFRDDEKKNYLPRRMVAGIRDAAKAVQRGRAQAIVFAEDAGADSKVGDLMAQATWKGVPVMVALPRAQLGKMIVRADITATVLVILHADGCEELFEEVTGRKPLPARYDMMANDEGVDEPSNVELRADTEPAVTYPWNKRVVSVEPVDPVERLGKYIAE